MFGAFPFGAGYFAQGPMSSGFQDPTSWDVLVLVMQDTSSIVIPEDVMVLPDRDTGEVEPA